MVINYKNSTNPSPSYFSVPFCSDITCFFSLLPMIHHLQPKAFSDSIVPSGRAFCKDILVTERMDAALSKRVALPPGVRTLPPAQRPGLGQVVHICMQSGDVQIQHLHFHTQSSCGSPEELPLPGGGSSVTCLPTTSCIARTVTGSKCPFQRGFFVPFLYKKMVFNSPLGDLGTLQVTPRLSKLLKLSPYYYPIFTFAALGCTPPNPLSKLPNRNPAHSEQRD